MQADVGATQQQWHTSDTTKVTQAATMIFLVANHKYLISTVQTAEQYRPCRYAVRAAKRLMDRRCTHRDAAVMA